MRCNSHPLMIIVNIHERNTITTAAMTIAIVFDCLAACANCVNAYLYKQLYEQCSRYLCSQKPTFNAETAAMHPCKVFHSMSSLIRTMSQAVSFVQWTSRQYRMITFLGPPYFYISIFLLCGSCGGNIAVFILHRSLWYMSGVPPTALWNLHARPGLCRLVDYF